MLWLDRIRLRRRLPTFVVIGAMKSGTTSLHQYLKTHPDVSMSDTKEINFFIAERNWPRGLDWYAEQFERAVPARGESSPNYTKRHQFEGVPARMHTVLPRARLIYVVRDPIDRAVSHAVHSVRKGRLPPGALTSFFQPPPGLRPSHPEYSFHHPDRGYYMLHASRYHYQLSAFLEYYPLRQVLVVDTDQLRHQRRATLRRVFSFIGVDPAHDTEAFDRVHHTTTGTQLETPTGDPFEPPTLTSSQREQMAAYLRDDVERFRHLTGQDFASWSL